MNRLRGRRTPRDRGERSADSADLRDRGCFVIDYRRQLADDLDRVPSFVRGKLSPAAKNCERIRDLERPQRGNNERVACNETIEHCLGFGSRLGRVHPRDRNRSVGDEGTLHFRPCPIASRTSAAESADLPRLRFRMRCCNRRSPSTDRCTESRFGAPSRTTRATGRSCRVMTISSPRSTRCRSSPKRVFASKAVILIMPRY
jgi:hypothetical protein